MECITVSIAKMANESIELLKNYDPKKMQWPALHQQKIDGVPVRINKEAGKVTSISRQNEPIRSIAHIERFADVLLRNGESLIMELYIHGKPFKEISGLVRAHKQCPALLGYVFDFNFPTSFDQTYAIRRSEIALRISSALEWSNSNGADTIIRMIPSTLCYSSKDADEAHEALMLANPDAEGSVLHSKSKLFQPGKRCWGTQRMKPVPTIDLLVVGFEEAISADGTPLGMVGRVNADFNTVTKTAGTKSGWVNTTIKIGIGPGALTHTERKELWRMFNKGQYTPRIAEIRYMRDDSYDALRQPTFKCWRDDKKEPDSVQSIRS